MQRTTRGLPDANPLLSESGGFPVLKLKRFFLLLFLASLSLAGLVALSLLGENDYLENCQHLNLNCEPGTVHKALSELAAFAGSALAKINAFKFWKP